METKEEKNWAELFLVPAIALVVVGVVVYFARQLGLPTPEKVVAFASKYYENYGLWVVFVGAILEGLLLVGIYFPGSIVVVLGMILAAGKPTQAFWTVIVACLGFMISNVFNYFLGKFGWYKLFLKFGMKEPLEKMEKRLAKTGLKSVFLIYYSPAFAAFASTSAGIFQYNFLTFLLFTLSAFAFWLTAWAIVAYFTGYWVLKLLTGYLLIVVLGVWLFASYKEYKKQLAK